MSTPPNSAPSSGDDRNLVSVDEHYIAPTFEDRLRLFWDKNGRTVLAVCALILAVILGKGAMEFIAAQREKGIAAEYGAAANSDQLKAFVAAHPDHMLGGIAQLRLADEAYAAGRFSDARAAYEKAVPALEKSPFAHRARLGAAISAVQAGATAEGEAALKQLVADLSADKLIRSEAAYHLAALAAAAGNAPEAIRLIEQATVIDPDGHWADRASSLRATLPSSSPQASVETPAADASSSVSFK